MHVCPKVEPGPVPHVGGPIIDAGQAIVTINGVPVVVVGGKASCTGVGASDGLVSGSSVFTIQGKPVVRMGDGCAQVIPPFFGALKSRGHAACAKRCFGV
ncbi:PAAR domain-containing protein [Aeromonas salmonicida]|uniref:PAAR domain-containing protein n=1 Tax=Aeromonas salmonicida TaxID=645 RepID=UPI00338E60E4